MKGDSWILGFALLAAIVGVHTAHAGCQEESARGFFTADGVGIWFVDERDGVAGALGYDGLPERYRCEGSDQTVPLLIRSRQLVCNDRALLVVGTADDDSVNFDAERQPVFFFGGDGDDLVTGSAFGDVLHGGFGDDTIDGGDGDDTICLVSGNRETGASPGPRQRARGGQGNDYVFGGLHPDAIDGGPGDDVVQGAIDDDRVSGGTGNDAVYGAIGQDLVLGGEGNDFLHGAEGADILIAGAGDDVLAAVDDFDDTRVNGGGHVAAGRNQSGFDTCHIDASEGTVSCDVVFKYLTCSRVLFAVQGVTLHRIDPDTGTNLGYATIVNAATDPPIVSVRAIAIPPRREEELACSMSALVVVGGVGGGAMHLATVDPLSGSAVLGEQVDGALVGIIYDGTRRLLGLVDAGDRAAVIELSPGRKAVGFVRHGGTPLYIAYDSPEGFLFIMTNDGLENHLDNFEPFLGHPNYVAVAGEIGPMTWDSDSNHLLEVDPDGSMWDRARRFGERTEKIDSDTGEQLYVRNEAGDILTGIVAIALPHFDFD